MKLDDLIEEKRLTLEITPLVDVVFLLVLFFAVTSSFIQPQVFQELKFKLAAIAFEKQQIDASLSANQAEIDLLNLQISRDQSEISQHREKTKQLTRQIAAVTTDITRLQEEKDEQGVQLRQQAQTIQQTEKNLTTIIANQRAHIRALGIDLRSAREEAQQNQVANSQMIARLAVQDRTLGDQDARIKQLQKALQAARLATAELQTDGDNVLARQQEQAQAAQAQLIRDLSRHTDRIRLVQADLVSRTDDNNRLQAHNEALQAELDEQRQLAHANDRRLQDLQRLNASQKANIREYEIQIRNLNQLVGHQTLKLQAIEQQSQNYRKMIAKQKQAMAEINAKVRRVAAENEKLFKLASTREEALNVQIKTFQELKQEKAALEARTQQHQKMLEAKHRQMDRLQQSINTDLGAAIKEHNIGVHRKQDRIILKLPDRIIFDVGSEIVKAQGMQVLRQVGAILKSRAQDTRIQVAGHTDNLPVRPGANFQDNWELSVKQAVNVILILQKEVGIEPRRLAAVGYGAHLPVASNDTPEGRAQNRRIEIVLQPQ